MSEPDLRLVWSRGPDRPDAEALLPKVARGDSQAFEQLYDALGASVYGVARRVVRDPNRAEDVAQEVFRSFGRSPVPAPEAAGWLTVAATHTALNLLRSGRRRSAREETAREAPAVVPDVADQVITRDERSAVRAALGRLPAKQAAALVLRHSGLSYAEVAAALDLSPGSVGTTVRRAESVLLKELNRHASPE